MLLLGFLSTTVGMLVGGGLSWLFNKLQQKINNIYAVCSGVIFGLICIEILPDAIQLSGLIISLIGLMTGVLTFDYIHTKLHVGKQFKTNYTGLLVMLSLSIHNLPMGILLGASPNEELRESVLLTLFFHSIPEGIILFISYILGSLNFIKWLFISFIISSPVIIGVFIGNSIGFEYKAISALIISFAAGNLFMVIIKDFLMIALKKSSSLMIVLLFFLGFVLMCIYLQIV